MPFKDPEVKKAYHRAYMKRRYSEDEEHRRKQKIRVKTKYLEKVELCSKCCRSGAEAHHPDYLNPEIVIWLCRECHLKEHEKR